MSSFDTMSLIEQLGNVSSEVGRAAEASRAGKRERAERAAERALELLDRVISDERWKGRRKELVRARALFADSQFGTSEHEADLERYFHQFAVAARLNR